MALRIRLRQHGRTNRSFYRLVVAEDRSRRDGKYTEAVGWYDPEGKTQQTSVSVNAERVQHWLDCGADMSENVKALVKRAAPDLMKRYQEKQLMHRAKMAAKRRERKKKHAV